MTNYKLKPTLIVLSFIISQFSFGNEIRFGQPFSGGPGCPRGTASSVVSPDGKTIQVVLDQFSVEAGKWVGQPVRRSTCSVAIPISIPVGYSVSLSSVQFKGSNELPEEASSNLDVEFFMDSARGPMMSKSFKGPLAGDYSLVLSPAESSIIWSPCRTSTSLRINTSLKVTTNSSVVKALSQMSGIGDIHLQLRKCN